MATIVDEEKCNSCESCVEECPSDAITIANNTAQIDIEMRVECGICVAVCPVEATSIE